MIASASASSPNSVSLSAAAAIRDRSIAGSLYGICARNARNRPRRMFFRLFLRTNSSYCDAVERELRGEHLAHLRRAARDDADPVVVLVQRAEQRGRAGVRLLVGGGLERALREIGDRVELGAQVGLVEVPAKRVPRRLRAGRQRRHVGLEQADALADPHRQLRRASEALLARQTSRGLDGCCARRARPSCARCCRTGFRRAPCARP